MTPTETITLADFILARIAEDEWEAKPFVNDLGESRPWTAAEVGGRVYDLPWDNPNGTVANATTNLAARHIARHDPARVLADCEAKRRIVEEHPQTASIRDPHDMKFYVCATCETDVSPCPTLRLLALPYADHPDYREEWREEPSFVVETERDGPWVRRRIRNSEGIQSPFTEG